MRKTIWTGTCSAIIGMATIAITAQTASPPQNSTGSERRITVTGCLKPAPSTSSDTTAAAGTTGTAGTAGTTGTTGAAGAPAASTDAAAASAKFVLTNATVATPDTAAAGAPATPSAAPAPGTAAPAHTYRLVANAAALSPHVGKKLELTGTLEDQNNSATSASSDASASTANPTLRVEAGKVVAASCSE